MWRIPKRYTGPKGRRWFGARNAALKGPLFHGIIDSILVEEIGGVYAPKTLRD